MRADEAAKQFLVGGYGCGEAVLLGLREARVLDIPDAMVRAARGFAGGFGGKKGVCGALIAGIQALGHKYRVDRLVDGKPAMEASGDLVAHSKERFRAVSCEELLKNFPDFSSPERKEYCAHFVVMVAEWLSVCRLSEETQT